MALPTLLKITKNNILVWMAVAEKLYNVFYTPEKPYNVFYTPEKLYNVFLHIYCLCLNIEEHV